MHDLIKKPLQAPRLLMQKSIDTSRNILSLQIVRVLRDLVNKLAVFLIPIYLFEVGANDPFWQFLPGTDLQKGLLLIALFYLVQRVIILIFSIPISKMILALGYQRVLSIGIVVNAIFLLLLYQSVHPGILLMGAAAAYGLSIVIFWPSYYSLLTRFAQKRHLGGNMGMIQVLVQLASVLTPALGGLLVVTYGYKALMIFGIVLLLAVIAVIYQLKLPREKDEVSWQEFREWLQDRTFVRLATAYAGRYFNDAAILLWPLFVFLLLGSIEKVGFLYSVSLFAALLISFSIGVYLDKNKTRKPFFASGGLLSLIWIARMQVWNFWQVAILDSLDRLTANFHWLYFDVKSMKRGKGSQALSFFVYREMIFSLAAILFWLIIALIFWLVPNPWSALFALAAIGVIMSLLIKEHRT